MVFGGLFQSNKPKSPQQLQRILQWNILIGNEDVVVSLLTDPATKGLVDPNGFYKPRVADRGVPRKKLRKASRGLYLLHTAVLGGYTEMVKALLAAGAEVNQRDLTLYQYTPLYYARHEETILALVKAGADANVVDVKRGRTPLMLLCEHGDEDVSLLLIEEGKALIEGVTDKSGFTPLHHAANAGNYNVVKLLLDKGAAPEPKTLGDREDNMKVTPLHLAAEHAYRNVVRLLIQEGGASPKTCDKQGKNALDYALEKGGAIPGDLWAAKNGATKERNNGAATPAAPKEMARPKGGKPQKKADTYRRSGDDDDDDDDIDSNDATDERPEKACLDVVKKKNTAGKVAESKTNKMKPKKESKINDDNDDDDESSA